MYLAPQARHLKKCQSWMNVIILAAIATISNRTICYCKATILRVRNPSLDIHSTFATKGAPLGSKLSANFPNLSRQPSIRHKLGICCENNRKERVFGF